MRSIADAAEERWIGTQMIDREKVLNGLECLADENSACHSDCPYFTDREDGGFCFRKMAYDALELLKEQEAKILTFDELKESTYMKWHSKHGCLWLETKFGCLAPGLFDVKYGKLYRMNSIYLHPADGGDITWWDETYYQRTWRAWTAKPTDKQREEAKWDDEQ